MPQYRYTATTPDGKRVEGTTDANQWQDVDRALQNRGLKMTGIAEIPASQSAPNQPRTAPSPTVQTAKVANRHAAPVQIQKASAQASVSSKQSPPALIHTKKTKYATDKDLFFLFSQIASYLKSGVNPAQAYENLSKSMSQSKFADALQEFSRSATNGLSVASAMAMYPYLFPPHVVGLYRAGETAGFLPAACELLSEQANASHKFKRWFFWLGICFVSLLAAYPEVVWGVRSLLAIWDKAEAAGGNVDPFKNAAESFGEQFVKTLPFTIAYCGAITIAYLVWKSMRFRRLRHKLTLLAPTSGKRARVESMAVFSWTLSQLFRIGMAPKPAVELAAAAMPNLELSEQMARAASGMKPETKLSEVADQVSMLTPEMRSIVMTGEYVGDLPGALNNVAQVHRAEFSAVDQASKSRIGCWMMLVVLVGSCLMGAIFYGSFYDGLIKRVLGE